MRLVTICLFVMLLTSCGGRKSGDAIMFINKDTFDLVKTKTEVKSCERIQISVMDDINPRYQIVTTDSMILKSERFVSVGDSIVVNVYKKRKSHEAGD